MSDYDDHGPFDPDELVEWSCCALFAQPSGCPQDVAHGENERAGFCIDVDRVRAEAHRPMDKPKSEGKS